jgi:hypothetical protein
VAGRVHGASDRGARAINSAHHAEKSSSRL